MHWLSTSWATAQNDGSKLFPCTAYNSDNMPLGNGTWFDSAAARGTCKGQKLFIGNKLFHARHFIVHLQLQYFPLCIAKGENWRLHSNKSAIQVADRWRSKRTCKGWKTAHLKTDRVDSWLPITRVKVLMIRAVHDYKYIQIQFDYYGMIVIKIHLIII